MSAKKIAEKNLKDLQALLKSSWAGGAKVLGEAGVDSSTDLSPYVLTTQKMEPDEVLRLALERGARHICQTDAGALESEVQAAGAMLFRPALFLSCPISVILNPAKASMVRENQLTKLHLRFHSTADKPAVLKAFGDYMRKFGRTESLVNDALMIADEMFTNAIFNAPFVNPDTGINPGISRVDSRVELNRGQWGEITVGHDEERLVIACRDPYGSLDVRQLLQRIRDCWRGGVSANMNQGNGGAGIGSFMVFNASSSLYIGVEKHGMTVVAVTLHWKWSARERAGATKNLHWFSN